LIGRSSGENSLSCWDWQDRDRDRPMFEGRCGRSGSGAVAAELSGPARGDEGLKLSDFRAIRVSWFLRPVIANLQRLIRIERASASASERLWNRSHGVARGCALHCKDVAAVLAVRENFGDQIGCRGPGRAAGGRTELREGRVLAKLRVILGLSLVDGGDLANGGHLMRGHHLVVHLRHGNGRNNQDDRNHDQQLDQGKAAPAPILTHASILDEPRSEVVQAGSGLAPRPQASREAQARHESACYLDRSCYGVFVKR